MVFLRSYPQCRDMQNHFRICVDRDDVKQHYSKTIDKMSHSSVMLRSSLTQTSSWSQLNIFPLFCCQTLVWSVCCRLQLCFHKCPWCDLLLWPTSFKRLNCCVQRDLSYPCSTVVKYLQHVWMYLSLQTLELQEIWTVGWMSGWTDGWLDGWIVEWMVDCWIYC